MLPATVDGEEEDRPDWEHESPGQEAAQKKEEPGQDAAHTNAAQNETPVALNLCEGPTGKYGANALLRNPETQV